MKSRRTGSLLLEIAIGISVMGIIAGGFMAYFSATTKISRERVTKDNIETVVVSVAAFLAKNSRLPKPADDLNGAEGSSNGHYVPYKALGIAKKIAMDGNHKPLCYIAQPELASKISKIYGDISGNAFCTASTATLQIPQYTDIAFIVDTHECKITAGDFIKITPTNSAAILSRDMLLMKYLKSGPCKQVQYPMEEKQPAENVDLFGF